MILPDRECSKTYYDIIEDWDLIDASFRTQYGIRLLNVIDEMAWQEFAALLGGIMGDTPLGRIVEIRSEKNPEMLKNFSSEQRAIRNRWVKAHGGVFSELESMQANLKAMFT